MAGSQQELGICVGFFAYCWLFLSLLSRDVRTLYLRRNEYWFRNRHPRLTWTMLISGLIYAGVSRPLNVLVEWYRIGHDTKTTAFILGYIYEILNSVTLYLLVLCTTMRFWLINFDFHMAIHCSEQRWKQLLLLDSSDLDLRITDRNGQKLAKFQSNSGIKVWTRMQAGTDTDNGLSEVDNDVLPIPDGTLDITAETPLSASVEIAGQSIVVSSAKRTADVDDDDGDLPPKLEHSDSGGDDRINAQSEFIQSIDDEKNVDDGGNAKWFFVRYRKSLGSENYWLRRLVLMTGLLTAIIIGIYPINEGMWIPVVHASVVISGMMATLSMIYFLPHYYDNIKVREEHTMLLWFVGPLVLLYAGFVITFNVIPVNFTATLIRQGNNVVSIQVGLLIIFSWLPRQFSLDGAPLVPNLGNTQVPGQSASATLSYLTRIATGRKRETDGMSATNGRSADPSSKADSSQVTQSGVHSAMVDRRGDLKLLKVLADPVGFRVFMEHMWSELNYENLLCCVELIQFRHERKMTLLEFDFQQRLSDDGVIIGGGADPSSEAECRNIAVQPMDTGDILKRMTEQNMKSSLRKLQEQKEKEERMKQEQQQQQYQESQVLRQKLSLIPDSSSNKGTVVARETDPSSAGFGGDHTAELDDAEIEPLQTIETETIMSAITGITIGNSETILGLSERSTLSRQMKKNKSSSKQSASEMKSSDDDPKSDEDSDNEENSKSEDSSGISEEDGQGLSLASVSKMAHKRVISSLRMSGVHRLVIVDEILDMRPTISTNQAWSFAERFLRLYSKYIFTGAPMSVNISYKTRKRLAGFADILKRARVDSIKKRPSLMTRRGPSSEEIQRKQTDRHVAVHYKVFDRCIVELIRVMNDSFVRFSSTPAAERLFEYLERKSIDK